MVDPAPGLPLTGGCLCGGVRWEVREPLLDAGWCHCTRCRRRTGTHGSVQARTQPGSFRIVAGEELVREFRPPTGGWVKAFCSTCGSALFSFDPADPDRLAVRLGGFDGDPGVRPSFHNRVETAVVWQPLPDDGLPRFRSGELDL